MYFQKISMTHPSPPFPHEWQQKFQRDGGGVQKETISEGVGGCYRGLFPGGLSETGELLINNSSVEKAVSYLLLPVILLSPVLQNKYYDLFPLINFYLRSAKCFFQKYSDQFRFLGNCPPTPPRSQHFGLSKK